MKRVLFRLLDWCGIPALLRFWHRHSLTIVLYHGVAAHSDQGIYNYRGKFISPATFATQMTYLKRRYTILPLEDAIAKLSDGSLPPYALVITFDDGYRNFKDYALPILSDAGAPSTLFVATDFVCRNVPLWVDRLEYAIGKSDDTYADKIREDEQKRESFKKLSPQQREHDLRNIEQIAWTKFEDFSDDRAVYAPLSTVELQSLATRGITIGAHTQTHPILAQQTPDEQRREIEGSRVDIEALGIAVSPVFAYPNGQPGDWNTDTEQALAASGFTHALTTIEGTNTAATHPYRLRRFALDATEDMATFANIVSGVRLFLKSIL